MKWYKHDPSAALAGMIGLTVEERGAYYTLIDLQYARAPHNHVTDELVIKALAVRPQVWRRLKAALVAKGKVREIDGKLIANRVETQVKLVMYRGGFRGQIEENQTLKPDRYYRYQNIEAVCPANAGHPVTSSPMALDQPLSPSPQVGPPPPSPVRAVSPEADLFRRGKEILGAKSGGLIANLLKSRKSNVVEVMGILENAADAENPREYIGRVLSGRVRQDDLQTIIGF